MKIIFCALVLWVAPESAAAAASRVDADILAVSTIGVNSGQGLRISSSAVAIENAGISLSGAGGYVNGQSSISASAFFGDGSSLTGISQLTSTQNFSGANSFSSSVAVRSNGRQIILSTSAVSSNISISSGGVISFWPQLHNSSYTNIPQYSTSITTFGPCIDGSTLTINAGGGRIELAFIGTFYDTASQRYGLVFLEDGQYVDNMGPTRGIIKDENTMTARSQGFNYLLGTRLGAHSYCLSLARFPPFGAAGSIYLVTDGSVVPSGIRNFSNFFIVQEIK